MNKDPNLKEQLVEAYKEIKEIEREKESSKAIVLIGMFFIAGLLFLEPIFIRPMFNTISNAVKCGKPTQQCSDLLFRHDE
jgi:hypothetical protein